MEPNADGVIVRETGLGRHEILPGGMELVVERFGFLARYEEVRRSYELRTGRRFPWDATGDPLPPEPARAESPAL
jgi:hypothetical protein